MDFADGSAVFIRCFMDEYMGFDGYAPISGLNEAGERIWLDLVPNSRLFEFKSYGLGARTGSRRQTLNADDAAWYTPDHVLNGRNPNREE